MTVVCGIVVAVRLSCLLFLSFFFNFIFRDTHNGGAVYQRARRGTSGPARLTQCLSLLTDGIWDGRLQNVPWWGTLVGTVSEPLPTLATERSHGAACGWAQAGCAFFPFGKRKKTQWYLNICKAIFDFRFKTFFFSFPKYSLFPSLEFLSH